MGDWSLRRLQHSCSKHRSLRQIIWVPSLACTPLSRRLGGRPKCGSSTSGRRSQHRVLRMLDLALRLPAAYLGRGC